MRSRARTHLGQPLNHSEPIYALHVLLHFSLTFRPFSADTSTRSVNQNSKIGFGFSGHPAVGLLCRMDENYNILPHGVNFQDAIFPDTSENRRTFSSLFQFSNCTQGSQPFHTFSPEWDTQEDSRVNHTLISSSPVTMSLNRDRLRTLVQCDWAAGCHSNICFLSLEEIRCECIFLQLHSRLCVWRGCRRTPRCHGDIRVKAGNQKHGADILLLLYKSKLSVLLGCSRVCVCVKRSVLRSTAWIHFLKRINGF